MPWQTQHLVLPLGILGGWFLGKVWDITDWRGLLRQGAGNVMVLLPVGFFSLLVLSATTLGQPRAFSGMALEQLYVTLRWLLSLVLFLIVLAFMYRHGRQHASRCVVLVCQGRQTQCRDQRDAFFIHADLVHAAFIAIERCLERLHDLLERRVEKTIWPTPSSLRRLVQKLAR